MKTFVDYEHYYRFNMIDDFFGADWLATLGL